MEAKIEERNRKIRQIIEIVCVAVVIVLALVVAAWFFRDQIISAWCQISYAFTGKDLNGHFFDRNFQCLSLMR